jgi:hypothetical protein
MNKITITSLVIAVIAVAIAVFALVSQNGQQAGTAVTRPLVSTPTATTTTPTTSQVTSTPTTPTSVKKAGEVVFGKQQIMTVTINDKSTIRMTVIPVALMTSSTEGILVGYRLSAIENGTIFVDAAKTIAAASDFASVSIRLQGELDRLAPLIDQAKTSSDFKVTITAVSNDFAAQGLTVVARDTGFVPFFIVNDNFVNLTDRQMNQLLNMLNEVSRNIIQLVG